MPQFTSMLFASIIIADIQMDVQLLRGNNHVQAQEKSAILHQQTQLLLAAIPFGSGDKIQEACSFGPIEDLVYKTIQTICDEKGLVILEMNGEADHVHILFEADPFTCVGELVNVIKTKTSRFVRKQYGDTLLKPYYWKSLFWSDSYFVTSVSENSLTNIKTYIQNQ